jgi:hypothetical protein
LTPVGDTYISVETPDTNYGSSEVLEAFSSFRLDNPYYKAKATFLRFDEALLPARVARARLRMTALESTTGPMPRARACYVNDNTTGAPWQENELTWNRAQVVDWGWPEIYQPTDRGADWLEWDIAGLLFFHGSKPLKSLLVDNYSMTFASRESASPPQLVIDYLVEPTAAKTFKPTNDAHVISSSPNGIFNRKTLNVKDAAADINTYVKFNVQGLTGTVQSAKLRLYGKDPGPDGGKVYAVSPFYKATTTQWLETGLKWKNAPAISGSPVATIGPVVLNRWVEVDVTQAVIDGIAYQNGRVSFAITNDSTNLVTYSSKEGTRPPELVVVIAP